MAKSKATTKVRMLEAVIVGWPDVTEAPDPSTGKPVAFQNRLTPKVGDVILVPPDVASAMVAAGQCQIVEPAPAAT